jgi:GxxExxY protein
MLELIFKEQAYGIIGVCMEVHNILGKGHSENIYKDALEIEFQEQRIPYSREQKFIVEYKGRVLPHYYFADFVVHDKIILEAKAIEMLSSGHTRQP